MNWLDLQPTAAARTARGDRLVKLRVVVLALPLAPVARFGQNDTEVVDESRPGTADVEKVRHPVWPGFSHARADRKRKLRWTTGALRSMCKSLPFHWAACKYHGEILRSGVRDADDEQTKAKRRNILIILSQAVSLSGSAEEALGLGGAAALSSLGAAAAGLARLRAVSRMHPRVRL